MPKPGFDGGAERRRGGRSAQLSNGIEGQIAELCRDLAIETKRMRQLQEQADELRMVISRWVSDAEPVDPVREAVSRAGRR